MRSAISPIDSRAADLLFEVVSRRHERRPIILTTNKPFAEWNQVFPNSSSLTALVDRLLHRAEIVKIEGDSYRAKEAKEHAAHKARKRAARSKKRKGTRKNTAQGTPKNAAQGIRKNATQV